MKQFDERCDTALTEIQSETNKLVNVFKTLHVKPKFENRVELKDDCSSHIK